MSRHIEISLPPELRARLLPRVQALPGVVRVTLMPGASVAPPGDVLALDATNGAALAVLDLFDELDAFTRGTISIGEPTALVAEAHRDALDGQSNEAAWEDMGDQLRRDTKLTPNFLLLMAISGAISTFGLVSDTLHVVVGAMLVAPGFEPLLRIAFGLAGSRHSPLDGIRSTLGGYLSLAIGAAAALPLALLLQGRALADLPALHWVGYWSSIQPSGIAVSLLAGVAGATIVSARLTVFATGVMVALALVPSMALVGLGLAAGRPDLALGGLLRWGVEVGCVLLAGGAVLAIKRRLLHRRRVFG